MRDPHRSEDVLLCFGKCIWSEQGAVRYSSLTAPWSEHSLYEAFALIIIMRHGVRTMANSTKVSRKFVLKLFRCHKSCLHARNFKLIRKICEIFDSLKRFVKKYYQTGPSLSQTNISSYPNRNIQLLSSF